MSGVEETRKSKMFIVEEVEKSEKRHVIGTHINTSPNDIDRQKGLLGYEKNVIIFILL